MGRFATLTRVVRRNEVLLLLGVSLGYSAVRAVMAMIRKLTEAVPLNQQTSVLNPAIVPDRPWLDLAYQLMYIGFGLVPALFAIHLLNRDEPVGSAGRLLGLDLNHKRFDLGMGAILALVIGLPGLGLYVLARELGANTNIQASALSDVWWAVPVLIMAAAQNAILEEVVVVGYLVTRLRQLNWQIPLVIAASALLRGTYHLYQGWGGFIGNALMGVVFAVVFLRWRRTAPLIIAHTLLDVVAFVGYAYLSDRLDWI